MVYFSGLSSQENYRLETGWSRVRALPRPISQVGWSAETTLPHNQTAVACTRMPCCAQAFGLCFGVQVTGDPTDKHRHCCQAAGACEHCHAHGPSWRLKSQGRAWIWLQLLGSQLRTAQLRWCSCQEYLERCLRLALHLIQGPTPRFCAPVIAAQRPAGAPARLTVLEWPGPRLHPALPTSSRSRVKPRAVLVGCLHSISSGTGAVPALSAGSGDRGSRRPWPGSVQLPGYDLAGEQGFRMSSTVTSWSQMLCSLLRQDQGIVRTAISTAWTRSSDIQSDKTGPIQGWGRPPRPGDEP